MEEIDLKNKNTFSKLLVFAGEHKRKMVASLLLAVSGVLFGMIPYLSVANIIAEFYSKSVTINSILFWSVLAIVGQVLKCMLTSLSTMKSHEAAFTILKNIQIKLTKKMERLPMGVVIDTPSGTWKALIVDTVDKLEKPLAHILPEMTSNVLAPVAIIITLLAINWKMAVASLITIPVGFIFYMGQMIGYKEKSQKYFEAADGMNNAIVEYVNGIEVIKAFNQSASSYGKYTHAVTYFRDSTLAWWKNCWGFSASAYSVMGSTLIVTLPVGSYLFMNGEMTFSSFIICVVLSLGVAGPIMAASQFVDDFAVVYQSVNQVTDALNQDELKRETKEVKLDGSGYVFENVSFGYGNEEILHNINLKTVKNGITAIVGPSGSGKSTIAKLMVGFWDCLSGTIKLGGKDIKNIPLEQLMKNISYVSQDNFLFDISIKENIRLGRQDATDEEIYEAAKAANCHEFILKLEYGYETKVGEAGGKLSGGERQRITIARAILKNSNVIILDEATAYTDPENEAVIQEAIGNLINGKTLIVIAHRLSTIKNANKILVIENGKVVSEGTQEELLANSPLYKRMWTNHVETIDSLGVA